MILPHPRSVGETPSRGRRGAPRCAATPARDGSCHQRCRDLVQRQRELRNQYPHTGSLLAYDGVVQGLRKTLLEPFYMARLHLLQYRAQATVEFYILTKESTTEGLWAESRRDTQCAGRNSESV